jgi:hypothetical protein
MFQISELCVQCITRAIRKVTSSELLTKQAVRKNVLYRKNTYILKLLLNLFTAGIEALVISRNKFLYAICELRHILYCETQKKLCRGIQNKKCEMLTSSVLFLHDCMSAISCSHSSTAGAFQLLLCRATTTCLPT